MYVDVFISLIFPTKQPPNETIIKKRMLKTYLNTFSCFSLRTQDKFDFLFVHSRLLLLNIVTQDTTKATKENPHGDAAQITLLVTINMFYNFIFPFFMMR